jgi:hypothetical protein
MTEPTGPPLLQPHDHDAVHWPLPSSKSTPVCDRAAPVSPFWSPILTTDPAKITCIRCFDLQHTTDALPAGLERAIEQGVADGSIFSASSRDPIEGFIQPNVTDALRPHLTAWHVPADITLDEVNRLAYELATEADGRYEVDLLSGTIRIDTEIVGVGHPGVVVLIKVAGSGAVLVAGRLDIKELR